MIVPEERCEDVRDAPEVGEGGVEPSAAETGVPEAVVGRPPAGIRQHLVGLRHLAETPVRVGGRGDVWMQLARELAEGPLYLGVARVARDAEHVVVVTLGRRHLGSVLVVDVLDEP